MYIKITRKTSLKTAHHGKCFTTQSFWVLNILFSSVLQRNPSPSEVVQWSNHRVMEWLRSVDLAEFAPNLRGSGVHGGLIVCAEHGEIFFF